LFGSAFSQIRLMLSWIDNNPATAIRPPGLRSFNAASPAASAVGDDMSNMIADISTLIGVVVNVGGPIAIIGSRSRIANMRLRVPYSGAWQDGSFLLFPSASLADDELVAVATDAFVSAADQVPSIRISRESVAHFETNPQPIIGSGGQLAVPTQSLWQARSVGLLLKFALDWGLRAPNAVSWVQGVKW
jgi:hypothetical protein